MSRESAAVLAHDVGKYIARVATNVPPGEPVPSALVPLLIKDLYELPGAQRASARFDELAPEDSALQAVRESLREIDALEARVRAGEDDACQRACELARSVEAALRSHAKATP